jgi:polyisoprenyl-phosphate glycosyltransferase
LTVPGKLISIVTPCFNEEASIRECYDAVKALFENQLAGYRREHIFCDNASRDGTVAILREIAADDPSVKVIVNARNFGVFRSMFNGLLVSSGDAAVPFLPADLQDPPEIIAKFVALWEQGHHVVYGIRQNRRESFIVRVCRKLHYRLVNRLSSFDIPLDAGEFQLLDRKVVAALREFGDHEPYLRGMIAECGFNAVGVPYAWGIRKHGRSNTNFYQMIEITLNGLISFSNIPTRVILLAGVALSFLSLLYACVILVLVLIEPERAPVSGISTLLIGLFFFGGLQLFFLGVIGEYVTAIHAQVRSRPRVIEQERINFGSDQPKSTD